MKEGKDGTILIRSIWWWDQTLGLGLGRSWDCRGGWLHLRCPDCRDTVGGLEPRSGCGERSDKPRSLYHYRAWESCLASPHCSPASFR